MKNRLDTSINRRQLISLIGMSAAVAAPTLAYAAKVFNIPPQTDQPPVMHLPKRIVVSF